MTNNKRTSLLLVLSFVVGALVYRSWSSGPAVKKLRVLSWSQYLPKPFLDEFTKNTGIPVEVSLISSNEELFAKLKAGADGYDVLQPSDYMVERLDNLGFLSPLDKSKLPNLKNLAEHLTKLPYDPEQKYSIPFLEGTTGLIINKNRITIPPDGLSWSALFESTDPRNSYLMDDMREVFAAALFWKGKDPNHLDAQSVQIASEVLAKAKDHVIAFNSEPLGVIQRSEITIAHAFSYQAAEAMRTHTYLAYVLPKEGAVHWVDTLVVAAHSKKKAEAHIFLNYLLDRTHAAELEAANHLPGVISKSQKREQPKNLFFFRELNQDSLIRVGQAWTELKAG